MTPAFRVFHFTVIEFLTWTKQYLIYDELISKKANFNVINNSLSELSKLMVRQKGKIGAK